MTRTEPAVRSVRIDGRRVRYREAGGGAPVVLVAGLGLSGRFYDRSYAAYAAAGLRLIVPDLPGAGATRGPITGLDAASIAAFLERFATALGICAAGWIGHSIGWQPAARLAVARPDLVAALVAAAPTLPRRHRRAAWQLARFARVAARVDASVVHGVARDYIRTTPLHYVGTWLKHARDDPFSYAAAVRCPFLVLVGGRDPMSPEEDVAALLQRLPEACRIEVEDGTHGLPRQSAAAFNRITTRFLREALR
jgi:pimeloyl-ACP methyl ester carboxylesterase